MRKIFTFARAVLHHWGTLVTGGSIIGALGIYQNVGHPVAPWVYWTVAIMSLVIAFYRAWLDESNKVDSLMAEISKIAEKSASSPPSNATASPVVTANPIQTVSPAITVSPVFNLPNALPTPAEIPAALVKKVEPPKPNVRYVNRKVTTLEVMEGNYFNHISEATDEIMTTDSAFIASFRNDRIPGMIVPTWRNVSAQIIYRGEYGDEITQVGSASWVGTYQDGVDFDGGSVRSVILAIKQKEGKWVSVHVEKHMERRTNHYEIKSLELAKEIRTAEIILHDWKGLSLPSKKFLVDFNLGLFGES